jgi:hypothetical protein
VVAPRSSIGDAATAQGAPKTQITFRDINVPAEKEDWIEMSASSFERENIGLNSLSADSATKPFEHATHEHTWRPPAEGLYDLSQEKDSCGVGFIANI